MFNYVYLFVVFINYSILREILRERWIMDLEIEMVFKWF